MDSAKYWGVVGQRKMSCAVTEKRSMSKVSPGLWWWHEEICEIYNLTLICSMVVVTSPPRKPRFDFPEEQNTFSLIATKLACKSDVGREIMRLCVGGVS